jgi:hypothetical protein
VPERALHSRTRLQGAYATVHPRFVDARSRSQKPPMTVAMVQVGKLDLALYLHTQTHTIVMIKDGDSGKALRRLFKPWTSTTLLAIYLHMSCHTVVVIK